VVRVVNAGAELAAEGKGGTGQGEAVCQGESELCQQ